MSIVSHSQQVQNLLLINCIQLTIYHTLFSIANFSIVSVYFLLN